MSARTGATAAPHEVRQFAENPLEQALRYVTERHWDVLPGAWIESDSGAARCSCADPACDAPGAHPLRRDWAAQATGSAAEARRLWSHHPRAGILLPTGRTFDVLDVSEAAGCLALARMERIGIAPGPVSATPLGRMQFFVLPGGAAKAPGVLRRFGWSPAGLGLVPRGEGGWVVAPPTRMGHRGAAQWARRPTPLNRWLPDAEELLAPLGYACGQTSQTAQVAQTSRTGLAAPAGRTAPAGVGRR
ncbi:bifunctional DNA primase/polymerase [Streptomyces marincola]|nr:bifunctional DNA primase/polymerase [Streptomyces marincola]UCM91795.1 bifunctional DNA primase/polymerase [Streptomyces marincola]